MSCHSSGSLEGGCPSSTEVFEGTEDFIQFEGLHSLFSAVERFLYLRDICIRDIFVFETFLELFWFDRFLAATAAQEAHLTHFGRYLGTRCIFFKTDFCI